MPSTVELIISHLDAHPNATLTTRDLANQIGRAMTSVKAAAADPRLAAYRQGGGYQSGHGTTWGVQATGGTRTPPAGPRRLVGPVPAPTPPDPVDEDEQDRSDLQAATIRSLTSENKKLRTRLASVRQDIEAVVGAVRPIKAPTFISRAPAKASSRSTAVLCVADWHLGERVFASQTGGYEYDHEIARTGMLDISARFLQWVETQRHGYAIDDLVVLSLGDLTSGNIHPELIRTNSLPATVATARAAELLAETVGGLAPHFGHVRVVEVSADNHGRLDPKPPSKGAAFENWCYLSHAMANALLARYPNVECILSDDPMPVVSIEGHQIMALHGHQIRGGSNGSPYYGLTRHFSRVMACRYDQGLPPLLAVVQGHLHHHAVLEGRIILAPSLIGPSEYSIQLGLHSDPGQLAFLVGQHGIHGMTCFERRTQP